MFGRSCSPVPYTNNACQLHIRMEIPLHLDSPRPQQTQQSSTAHRAQCAARLRGIIMSSADGSADYVPEAEASAGKGEVGMESSVSNSEVQVVSASLSMVDFKPQRWQASRPVNSQAILCTRATAGSAMSTKEQAQCPTCAASVQELPTKATCGVTRGSASPGSPLTTQSNAPYFGSYEYCCCSL